MEMNASFLHPSLTFLILTCSILASFSTFCSIHVDLSAAVKDVILRKTRGQFYYELDYDVIIFLGLTEIQAYLEWKTRVSCGSTSLAFC